MSMLSAEGVGGYESASNEAMANAMGVCMPCDAMSGLVQYILQREAAAIGYDAKAEQYRAEHFVEDEPVGKFDAAYVEIMHELAETARRCADDARDGAVILRHGCHGPVRHNLYVDGKPTEVVLRCRAPQRSLLGLE